MKQGPHEQHDGDRWTTEEVVKMVRWAGYNGMLVGLGCLLNSPRRLPGILELPRDEAEQVVVDLAQHFSNQQGDGISVACLLRSSWEVEPRHIEEVGAMVDALISDVDPWEK